MHFELNWDRICECIGHEMWPKLASSIRGIVNDQKNNIKSDDFSDKTVQEIIEILKAKRNLAIEERMYFKALVQRAKPLNATHKCMYIYFHTETIQKR